MLKKYSIRKTILTLNIRLELLIIKEDRFYKWQEIFTESWF